MILVGELINSSRKSVREAIEERLIFSIQKLAKDQEEAGVQYIDINAGAFGKDEKVHLEWLVNTVLEAVDTACCIDSPNPKAIEAALKMHQEKTDQLPMINSISLEKRQYADMMSLLSGIDLKVVALCMSDEGIPKSADDKLKIAEKLINGLTKNGIIMDNIFVDPLVESISVSPKNGKEFFKALELIKQEFNGIHFMCGVSNISYGMPVRKHINQTFMNMAISHGLDGAIIDPLDSKMMISILTAEALSGKDEYCINFLQAYRGGMIKVE